MKFLMILSLLATSAFASEVATDCPAMNGSREKMKKRKKLKLRVNHRLD
jgi:hypothetical protein